MSRTAVISGILGQVGSFLAQILLSDGWEVYGLYKPTGRENFRYVRDHHGNSQFRLIACNVCDGGLVEEIIRETQPYCYYNLASDRSACGLFGLHHHISPDRSVDVIGVSNALRAIEKFAPDTKFINAASWEIFNPRRNSRKDEDEPRIPCTSLGVMKSAAFDFIQYYRSLGLWASSLVPFEHTSYRRASVYPEIQMAHWIVKNFRPGRNNNWKPLTKNIKPLVIDAPDLTIDWMHAKDVAEAFFIATEDNRRGPVDYVIGSGEVHSYSDIARVMLDYVKAPHDLIKINGDGQGNGMCCKKSMMMTKIGWQPRKTFQQTIHELITDVRQGI